MNSSNIDRHVWTAAAVALLACAVLAACGTAGVAGPTAGRLGPTTGGASATVDGRFVTVGGPTTESGGQPAARGRSGVIAVYTHMSHGKPIGAPIATTTTRAVDGGRFSIAVPPGVYDIVATNEGGVPIFDSARTTLSAGGVRHVTLRVAVP